VKKRPLIIRLLSYLYFVSPIAVIIELAWLNNVGIFHLGHIFNFVNWHVLLMFFITPLVGYGIWSVKKWGYYLLILHSVFLIFNNVVLYAGRETLLPLWAIIVCNLALVAVIVAFVKKEVCAPYFNPNIRWWEQASRYYSDMKITVKEFGTENKLFEAKSFDTSETGCFIVTDRDVDIRDKFSLELSLAKNSILYIDAEVVWGNSKKKRGGHPAGFGCRFIEPDYLFRKRMSFHMRDIRAKIKERG